MLIVWWTPGKPCLGRHFPPSDQLCLIIGSRFNEARIEAQSVDDLLDNPQTNREEIALSQPFLGVPFTTKDCFAVKGLSWTVGLLERKGQTASLDADTVQNMKEAGAIAMGGAW